MNSIKAEDIILPDYSGLIDCIYEDFLMEPGQEFDYENYNRALDKIEQIASQPDYNELESTITDACRNSAKHGFLMGTKIAMALLSGWQQGRGQQEAGGTLASAAGRTGCTDGKAQL